MMSMLLNFNYNLYDKNTFELPLFVNHHTDINNCGRCFLDGGRVSHFVIPHVSLVVGHFILHGCTFLGLLSEVTFYVFPPSSITIFQAGDMWHDVLAIQLYSPVASIWKASYITLHTMNHNIKTTAALQKSVNLQPRPWTIYIIPGSEHSQSVVCFASPWEKQRIY